MSTFWDNFNVDHYIKVLNARNSTDIEEKVDVDELIKEANMQKLVLFNDDVNTFDHVMSCLEIYCDHTSKQAEQCALIVHHNGKCKIKSGSFDELEPVHKKLSLNQLTVEIQ